MVAKYNGGTCYYQFDFEVVMLFGGTELEACIAWKENVRDFRPMDLH
jgi:hypothetical protein